MMKYFFVLNQYNRECNCVVIVFILFLCSICSVLADEIMLENGKIIKGNIVVENDSVLMDVVINGELVGAKITFNKSEIKNIQQDNEYRYFVKKKITDEKRWMNVIQSKERAKGHLDINKRILKRVQREAKRIKEIEAKQEDKRRFEKGLRHQKEMELLRGEVQKELIRESARSGINSNVYLINGN